MYVNQPNVSYTNVSIVIDGGPPKIQTIVPNGTEHTVSLYDVQSLSFSGHIIDISLLFFNNNHLFFDYAAVNDTQPSPTNATGWTGTLPSPSNGAPTSESTSTSTKSSAGRLALFLVHNILDASKFTKNYYSKHIGAIVGSVVGALAMIAAISVALLFCRQQKQVRDKMKVDPDLNITLFNTSNKSQITLARSSILLPNAGSSDTQLANNPALLEAGNIITASSRDHRSSFPLPNQDVLPPPSAGRLASDQLTVEQLVTLQTLYQLNTPAAEIVGVMERMMASGRQASGPSGSGLTDDDTMQDPPGYDSIPPSGFH